MSNKLQNVSNVKQAVGSMQYGAIPETVLTLINPSKLKKCISLETHSNGIISKMCS